MTDSSVFTPEEWALIRRSPILVFYHVAMADNKVESCEVEKLIELFAEPERFESAVFTQVVAEIMSDAASLAKTVAEILAEGNKNIAEQIAKLRVAVESKLDSSDAHAFKQALARFGVDIAAAAGDEEMPVSKEEWAEVESLKRMLGG